MRSPEKVDEVFALRLTERKIFGKLNELGFLSLKVEGFLNWEERYMSILEN